MAHCNICGDERDVSYYPAKHNRLCRSCAADTPRKVSREAFDKAYWPTDEKPCEAIWREFYEDYLASTYTLAEYKEHTTSEIL